MQMRRSVTDVEAGPVDARVIFDDAGSGAAAAKRARSQRDAAPRALAADDSAAGFPAATWGSSKPGLTSSPRRGKRACTAADPFASFARPDPATRIRVARGKR